MLSRVADNLYWMSRYLERAEHTARQIDLQLTLMLDQTPDAANRRWFRLLEGLHTTPPVDVHSAYAMTEHMAFSSTNSNSIVNCITAARENARNMREQISSEMWEQLNRLYLQVTNSSMDRVWDEGRHAFFMSVKEGAHLFQGITDSTMSHGEGWQFIQVARYIERAGATARLLDVHFREFINEPHGSVPMHEYMEWVGLLKSCTAYEAYCKVYTADLWPGKIAEFLILNSEFPHSIGFSVDMIYASLESIAQSTETRKARNLNRLAGRLRALLDYASIDEILSDDLHTYLKDIQKQAEQVHNVLYQAYIEYPIEQEFAV